MRRITFGAAASPVLVGALMPLMSVAEPVAEAKEGNILFHSALGEAKQLTSS